MKRSSNNQQWENIPNANQKQYKLTAYDDYYYIKVHVSYKDLQGYSESLESVSKLFEHVNHKPTGLVSITGTPQEGVTLNASNTISDQNGLADSINYQWERSFENNS